MKERSSSSEIHGLNRAYFHFVVTETFLERGLDCPSPQQIDAAIQRTGDLMKHVIETSFRLSSPQKIAADFGLSVLEIRHLYYHALYKVISMLEDQAESKEVN